MSKKKTEKQAEKRQPMELKDEELDKARGGAGTAQGLVAHELTHATQTGSNPKEISIDKSVPWNKS